MSMNPPSDEQQDIIYSVAEGKNVVVDACAGSGKSTTVLSCAKALPSLKFVQITFNKMLQEEVKHSVDKLQLENIQIFTYHGLAVKYYNSSCHNDMGIRRVLTDKADPRVSITPFQVLVLDETQDMTKIYYDIIWKFLIDMKGPIQLLILGDEKQALYEFKGADTRFLTMAETCWSKFPLLKNPEYITKKLLMSYRITDPMRDFVNKGMFGNERIRSCKPGLPVVYFKHSIYKFAAILHSRIQTLVLREHAKYEDFFILLRSIKSSNLIVQLMENYLVERGVPCFIPNSDDKDEMDARVIKNKVVFSTFHASKGRQRPYVFVLGFDDSHFTYFASDKDPNECPNEFYVACTRATKMLFVLECKDKNSHKMPFLKLNHNEMMRVPYVSFQGIPCGKKQENSTQPSGSLNTTEIKEIRKKMTPTEMTKFLPESALDILSPLIDELFVSLNLFTEEDTIPIKPIHETHSGSYEDVSDLNGIVLPIMYCDHLREKSNLGKIPVLQEMIRRNIQGIDEKYHPFLRNLVNNMPETCETIAEYLFTTCLFSASQECLYSRIKQIPIDDYSWITEEIVQCCFSRLDETIGEECKSGPWKTEAYIIRHTDDLHHILIDEILNDAFPDNITDNRVYRFSARADLITEESLWELKCTSQLTLEHKLQLVIYAWLYECSFSSRSDTTSKKKYYLFNIKTNEHLELQATREQMTNIIIEVIKGKTKNVALTDAEFASQF